MPDELLEQAAALLTYHPYRLPLDARLTTALLIRRVDPQFSNDRYADFEREMETLHHATCGIEKCFPQ